MSSAARFDLVVVGSGPGGYVGAIRAAQLGQRVAVVEQDRPGGVCLNWGCIPSKALLTGAELVESLRAHGETFGVVAGELRLDYAKAIDHSRKAADRLCRGVQSLFKKNQIALLRGRGRLAGPTSVAIEGPDAGLVEAANVVLATGSTEWTPPGVEVDGRRVLTSREALESRVIPGHIAIVGAGAVGAEFAYVYAEYGARVTLVEMADQMLPGADPDVAQALEREFRRKSIAVRTGTRFEELKPTDSGVRLSLRKGDQLEVLEADQVLLAIGRRPLSGDLGLESAGVALDAKGFVRVDAALATSAPSVRAIGDLVGAPLLAHKASKEGTVAAERAAGMPSAADWTVIPESVFCDPEVASAGLTEAKAVEAGYSVKRSRFQFAALGRALSAGEPEGFVKIVSKADDGLVLGVQIVGAEASNLISEVALAIEMGATVEDIALTVHPHPTLPEALMEAAESAAGKPVHQLRS